MEISERIEKNLAKKTPKARNVRPKEKDLGVG